MQHLGRYTDWIKNLALPITLHSWPLNPVSDRLSINAPVGSSICYSQCRGKVMLRGEVIQNETVDVTQIVSWGLILVELVIGSKLKVHKLIIAR